MFCNPQSQNQPMPGSCGGFNAPAQNAMNSYNMPPNQRPAQGNACMQVNPMGNGSIPMSPMQNVNPYGMNMPPMGNTNMGGNMGSPYGNMQPVRVDVSQQQPQQQQQNQWPQPQQQMYGMNNQQQLPALGFNNPMNNNNNPCMQCNYQQPQQQQQQPQNTYRPH